MWDHVDGSTRDTYGDFPASAEGRRGGGKGKEKEGAREWGRRREVGRVRMEVFGLFSNRCSSKKTEGGG